MGKDLRALVAIALVGTACTSASEPPTIPAPSSTTSTEAPTTASMPVPTTVPNSTTSSSVPTLTLPPRLDPIYYTFQSTLECDPDSEQAAFQVVQAFFTAYNEQNLERLKELVALDLNEIWDPSAMPHTGQVMNTDVAAWAQAGWEIEDRYELRRLTDYGQQAGSDFILIRRNQRTDALGIDGLVVGFTARSSGCTIHNLVGDILSRAVTNCPFFDLYGDELKQELTPGWEVPSVCTSGESTVNTYTDELGLIWYATDCPDADVLLFAGADALPPRERTELEAVEAMAEQSPEYRVIPRNGWVWEKLSDGSIVVIQVEDYMLERTIESAEQCPNVPSNNGGIAVAYRITGD